MKNTPRTQTMRAFNEALRYLAKCAKTEREMRVHLLKLGFLDDDAQYAIDRLSAIGVLNDAKYAEDLRASYERKGYGKLRLAEKLRQKGVDTEIIDEVSAKFMDDGADDPTLNESAVRFAAQFIRKRAGKKPDRNVYAAAMAAVARRGFAYDECREICIKARNMLQSEGELEKD